MPKSNNAHFGAQTKVVKALHQHVALGTMRERIAESKSIEKELKNACSDIKGLEVLLVSMTFYLLREVLLKGFLKDMKI